VKKLPVNWPPLVIVHVGFVTIITLLVDVVVIVHVPASSLENPLPDTVTRVLGGPDDGLSRIVGGAVLVTTNTANKICPLVPVMVIEYGPGGTLLTMKLPVIAPATVSEQPTKVTGEPVIEQVPPVPGLGSEASTVTTVLVGPDEGFRPVTTKICEAESPMPVVAVAVTV